LIEDPVVAYEKLNCLDQGTGPELMFVHSAGGNAAAWWQQLEYFSKTRRTLAYDLPGFGRSEAVSAQAIPEAFTNAALSVLDRFHVQHADVVCLSLCGWTGIHHALEHPLRVKKLVLSCTKAGTTHGQY
jgi:3-oxoadipate enol-lactonase